MKTLQTSLRDLAINRNPAGRSSLSQAQLVLCLGLILLVLRPVSALSQTSYTWSLGASGAWATAGNWSPSGTPGGNAGDTVTLGNATSNQIVTLSASETVSALTFIQTSAFTNELAIGGSNLYTLTDTSALTIGGNASGTERLYLDGIDTGDTDTAHLTDSSGITIGSNGVLEFSSDSSSVVPTVTGNITINSGGSLNIDQSATATGTISPVITGTVTLSSGGSINLSSANSGGVAPTASGTTYDERLTIDGNFLATGGSFTVAHATGTTTTNEIYFGGGVSTAIFDSGVTGLSSLTGINYSGTNAPASGIAFALESDDALPAVNFTSGATTSNVVNVSLGAVTAGGTLTVAGIALDAPSLTGGTHNGTLELTLTSNVNSGNVTGTSPHTGETLIFNLAGFTLDQSSYAGLFSNPTTTALNYVIEGGGTLKATNFELAGMTGSSASIMGATTLLATGLASGTTANETNSLGAPTGSIDPLSTFEYSGSVGGSTENYLTSTQTIGRLEVGDGTHTAILGVTTAALTVGADITVNTSGTLDLDGENVTETHGATATAGGLNGSGTVLNGTATTSSTVSGATNTLTLDTTKGNGSFSGVIKDNSSGTGKVALTKVGTGWQVLSGANTFTGAIAVNGGDLLITGSSSGGGAITVGSGGALGGSGGTITSSGITVASGGGLSVSGGGVVTAGTMTLALGSGSLNLSGAVGSTNGNTGELNFVLGSAHDEVKLSSTSSTLNIGSSLLNLADFTFTYGTGFGAGTYTLFDTSSASGITGTLASTDLTETLNGYSITLAEGTDISGYQDINLSVIAVPEPNSIALMLFGGAALLAFGWRRRRLQAAI